MDANDETENSAADQHRALGIDPETGNGMTGDYPSNLRLRAEALAGKGITTDPDGMASDELIAETAKRLAAEKAAQDQADADAKAAADKADDKPTPTPAPASVTPAAPLATGA